MSEHAAIRISQQTNSDLAVVDEIDQSVRGSTRRVDVEFWRRNEVQLVLHGGDGYALLGPNRVVALCAKTEAVASELLHSALSDYPDDLPRSIAWVVQDQQWAIVQAASDRATLEVHGAMMTRGVFSLPHPYLPNGLFT